MDHGGSSAVARFCFRVRAWDCSAPLDSSRVGCGTIWAGGIATWTLLREAEALGLEAGGAAGGGGGCPGVGRVWKGVGARGRGVGGRGMYSSEGSGSYGR